MAHRYVSPLKGSLPFEIALYWGRRESKIVHRRVSGVSTRYALLFTGKQICSAHNEYGEEMKCGEEIKCAPC